MPPRRRLPGGQQQPTGDALGRHQGHDTPTSSVVPVALEGVPRVRLGAPPADRSAGGGAPPQRAPYPDVAPEPGDLLPDQLHDQVGEHASESQVPVPGAARQTHPQRGGVLDGLAVEVSAWIHRGNVLVGVGHDARMPF